MLKSFQISTILFSLALLMWSACDDSNGVDANRGNLNVQITDDPFPSEEVSSAVVTINRVEIRSAGSSGDGDSFTTLTTETQTFNLLELTNDIVAPLANAEIEAGLYNQIRLFVSEASVTLEDGQTFNLTIPSSMQSGIKVNVSPAIEVTGGLTTELLLDFDVATSFVPRGQIGLPGFNGFIFKPVVRAANLSTSGRITGEVVTVDSAGTQQAVVEAQVWVTQSDSVFSTTFSNEEGAYALIGLPEGVYDLRATKMNFDTTLVEGVTVTAGNETTQNLSITPSN